MINLRSHISNDDFQSYLNTMTDLSNSQTKDILNKIRHDFTNYDDVWKSDVSYKSVVKSFSKFMKSFDMTPKTSKHLNTWVSLKLSDRL